MYLLDDVNASAVAVHTRVRDHVAARLHAARIDAELARGVLPDATVESALRSRRLTSDRSRRALAHGLERVMGHARPRPVAWSGVPGVNRAEIVAALSDIRELHELLLARGPVPVRGLAQVSVLVTTGTGPLYSRSAAADLGEDLRRAIEAMRVGVGSTAGLRG
jgi:hypothetical protein